MATIHRNWGLGKPDKMEKTEKRTKMEQTLWIVVLGTLKQFWKSSQEFSKETRENKTNALLTYLHKAGKPR